jgi:mycothiol system anti-sigma-R factor
MNCQETLEKLWQYLDKELDGASSSELQRHLDECRQCFSKVEFEQQLRAMVRRSCACEQAPLELRERLAKLLRLF